jgi:DNA-binding NarL/FixJ family response regulator
MEPTMRIHDGGRSDDAIRVMIAHGERLMRAGLRALLAGEADIAVAGEAAGGEEAVALAGQAEPDLILLDIDLPGPGGLEVARRILTDPGLPGVRVLVLAGRERDADLFGALRAGVTGFLVSDTEPADLLRAVRVVAAGGAELSPSVARRLIVELTAQPDPGRPTPEQLEELTAREREVMRLVAMGLTNGEIAEHLVLSPATAKTHVSRVLTKLHARDRARLVALAYETGFVEPRLPRALAIA